MAGTTTVRGGKISESLLDAIERGSPLTITYRDGHGWFSFSAIPFSYDETHKTLTVSAILARRAGTSLAVNAEFGVSFRRSHKKCMFSSRLLAITTAPDGSPAWVIQCPDRIDQLQRRSFDRVSPPPGMVIPVKFWPVASQQGAVEDNQLVCYGELEDLSAGGMRVNISASVQLPQDCTWRCVFAPYPDGQPFMIEAIIRHVEASNQTRHSVGFHFAGLEGNPDGRGTLNRLARTVAGFQRMQGRIETKDQK